MIIFEGGGAKRCDGNWPEPIWISEIGLDTMLVDAESNGYNRLVLLILVSLTRCMVILVGQCVSDNPRDSLQASGAIGDGISGFCRPTSSLQEPQTCLISS